MTEDGFAVTMGMQKQRKKETVMLTDIQIAQQAVMEPIEKIAEKAGIPEDALLKYGKYKAKISQDFINEASLREDGRLILVTAITPTAAGEGKTTVTVGLGQAMNQIGAKTIIALREPSLGPVMGVKGGATGGGYSQVVPMEDINLHFTGDMHAITAANNLLAAAIDNHLQQGNELDIDVRRIVWTRCMDMNDRALRNITVGLGGPANGVPREDHFVITVASEIMAILCLADGLADLKARLGRIIVAYNRKGVPVTAADIGVVGAMALLLKDAILPNLVQTLENTPALMHGGPFANIAHGCNSVAATKLGLKLADYCITEAGFGADLGAEKFMDIKCRTTGLRPAAVVIVATARALKLHGGVDKTALGVPDPDAVTAGCANLGKHIENMRSYGVPVLVAINHFYADTDEELQRIRDYCEKKGVRAIVADIFERGGAGGLELAKALVDLTDTEKAEFKPAYRLDQPVRDKIKELCRNIYGADDVTFAPKAGKMIDQLEQMGYGGLPICTAKTQYSLSDDPTLLGRPEHFTVTVRDVRLSAGAGFIVVLTGDIMSMPGLPKMPAANKLDIYENGEIVGLF